MEERSLDFFIKDRPFGFLVGAGAVLQSASIYFCNHKTYFLQLLLATILLHHFDKGVWGAIPP